MSFFLPFNHRPATSVDVYTDGDGQQTIAANTYARVVANVNNGGSFLINGVAALSASAGGESRANNTEAAGAAFTMTTGRGGVITTQGATFEIRVQGTTISPVAVTAGNDYVMAGTDVLQKTTGASSMSYQVRYTDGLAGPFQQEFWLDAGDICEINGNGAMSVEVYPTT